MLNHVAHVRIERCQPQRHTVAAQPLVRVGQHRECRILEIRQRAAVKDDDLRRGILDQPPHLLANALGIAEVHAAFELRHTVL
jgi:hypothetical protein